MRKTTTIIIIALAAVLSGCDKLEIQNKNSLSTGNFWKSEDDIESGLIAVYGMFYRQGTWTRNMYTQMNGMADDGVSYAGWTELNEWTKFKYTNYNFDESQAKMWREHWTAINRANQVLDNIPNVSFADEAHKNDLYAQAKFLRSFYYYYMVALWENIPLLLQTSSASDMPQTVSSDVIFTQLEKDLEEVIPMLPETRDAKNTGRPTKGSAYALLSKIYMQHKKWSDAARTLEWIVDGEGKKLYELTANYGDNFNNRTENNKESLYEIHFSLTHYVGFDQTDNYRDPAAQLGTQIEENQAPPGIGWNNVEARRWLVDYFKREKTTTGAFDDRLYHTLWYDGAESDFPAYTHDIYGGGWKSEWASRCFIKKYSTDVKPLYYWNDNNFRSFRLADMLLLYAEALNEVNGKPTAKAVECVDRVRARAGLAPLSGSAFYTDPKILTDKKAFLEHLKIERGLELALECVRWIDLKRWGFTSENLTEIKKRDADYDNFIIGKHECLPILQTDVDNNPNLVQNPNY